MKDETMPSSTRLVIIWALLFHAARSPCHALPPGLVAYCPPLQHLPPYLLFLPHAHSPAAGVAHSLSRLPLGDPSAYYESTVASAVAVVAAAGSRAIHTLPWVAAASQPDVIPLRPGHPARSRVLGSRPPATLAGRRRRRGRERKKKVN